MLLTPDTPSGPARLHLDGEGARRLVLGHGAGGGVDAPDLLAARDAGLAAGMQVVRVEQPWRVHGRRVAEAPARLDAAWLAAVAALPPLPCVLGGRSAGGRVACRTAGAVPDVLGVVCLGFPLVPPGRAVSRDGELDLPAVPRLVVQGSRDPFGVPAERPGLRVHVVTGADHALAVRRRDGRAPQDVREELLRVLRTWFEALAGGQTLT